MVDLAFKLRASKVVLRPQNIVKSCFLMKKHKDAASVRFSWPKDWGQAEDEGEGEEASPGEGVGPYDRPWREGGAQTLRRAGFGWGQQESSQEAPGAAWARVQRYSEGPVHHAQPPARSNIEAQAVRESRDLRQTGQVAQEESAFAESAPLEEETACDPTGCGSDSSRGARCVRLRKKTRGVARGDKRGQGGEAREAALRGTARTASGTAGCPEKETIL